MARAKRKPKATPKPETEGDEAKVKDDPDRDFVKRVRDRLTVMQQADDTNRELAMEDFKFVNVPGEQWTPTMKKDRGKRPCYEFNELRIKCKRIINDMRANRPAAKVLGAEDSDKDTAEIIEGLSRNILNTSDADTIFDNAGEYQVAAGMGAWRVTTDYESDMSMNQDIYVEAIKNPFCLYCDPAAQDAMKRDAEDWILTDKITRKAYEARWPGKKVVSFDDGTTFDDDDEWGCGSGKESEMVRIAEYWYKEPIEVELWQLSDGKVIDAADDASKLIDQTRIVKKRTAKSHTIMMGIVSGDAVLDPPTECAGKEHRFVMVFGESMVIDGKETWFGLARFGKDAQRNINLTQTAAMEMTAMNLQSKYWGTVKQLEGLAEKIAQAFSENIPVVTYNHDSEEPGPPKRIMGPEVPAAFLQLGLQASQLLNSTTGIHEESLGETSNARSGKAILAKQQQGEVATFNYRDNMLKGVQRTHEIFIDLIPEVIDTERTIRILGADGAQKFVKVNEVVQNPNDPANPLVLKDLRRGKYDLVMSSGPNFATKRQEASEVWREMAQADPLLMQTAPDLVYKSMDVPYSEDIAERRRAMLPPPIQEMLAKDQKQSPEVQAAMAQVKQAQALVEQQAAVVQQAAQEAGQETAQAGKAKADVQTALANLKTEEAKFEARVAKAELAIGKQQAALDATLAQVQQGTEDMQKSEQLAAEVAQAIQDVHAMVQRVAQAAAAAVDELANSHEQMAAVVSRPKPRLVSVNMERVNGKVSARPVYEDQVQQQGLRQP